MRFPVPYYPSPLELLAFFSVWHEARTTRRSLFAVVQMIKFRSSWSGYISDGKGSNMFQLFNLFNLAWNFWGQPLAKNFAFRFLFHHELCQETRKPDYTCVLYNLLHAFFRLCSFLLGERASKPCKKMPEVIPAARLHEVNWTWRSWGTQVQPCMALQRSLTLRCRQRLLQPRQPLP